MHTRFSDRLPMRAALAYYLDNGPQPSGGGISKGHTDAIKWPSGTGGICTELDRGTQGMSGDKEWIVELCTHHERLGIYKVTWVDPEFAGLEKEIWLVHELDHYEFGESVDIDSVESWTSDGPKEESN